MGYALVHSNNINALVEKRITKNNTTDTALIIRISLRKTLGLCPKDSPNLQSEKDATT
jgi:hypothetical protein